MDQHTRAAADRLRGGLDDDAGVDRRAARRPRAHGRRGGRGVGARALAAAARACSRRASLNGGQLRRPRRAAGAEGQRRRPLARPRLPGADHRAGAAGRAQHEVGRGDRVRMRARYGASPLHLLAHLVALPLVAFALLQIAERGDAPRILIWLALSARRARPRAAALLRRARPGRRSARAGRAVNYVRVPALLSGLLLLVFFPVISGKGERRLPRRQRARLRRLPRALAADHRGAVRALRRATLPGRSRRRGRGAERRPARDP